MCVCVSVFCFEVPVLCTVSSDRKFLKLVLNNSIQCFPFQILLWSHTVHWHSQNSIDLPQLIGSIEYLGSFRSDRLHAGIVLRVLQRKGTVFSVKPQASSYVPAGIIPPLLPVGEGG